MSSTVQRKLTTILAADAVGYSRAMEEDELSAFGALRAAKSVFSKFIERHQGRIVNTAGDGLIAEFPSVVEAVQCAIEIQQELVVCNRDQENPLRFRIGIHLGDVMIDGSDLLGEGVNLAARLETMAEPGGVLISQQVYDQVQHKLSIGFEYLGEKRPKNFAEDVPVYRLSIGNKPRSAGRGTYKAKTVQNAKSSKAGSVALRERVVLHTKLLIAFILVIGVVNLMTGTPYWAHWPGLVLATLLALEAAPMFVHGWFKLSYVRGIIIVVALAVTNFFTWTGYPWVVWPAAALISVALIRRLAFRSE